MGSVGLHTRRAPYELLRQRDDDPRRGTPRHNAVWRGAGGTHAVALLEVLGEAAVVLQPPQRRLRNQQEVGAALAQPLQLDDAGVAVGRMVPGICAVVALRKMPASVVGKPEELVVTLAENEHRGSGRKSVIDELTDARDQAVVFGIGPPVVGRPGLSPLVF